MDHMELAQVEFLINKNQQKDCDNTTFNVIYIWVIDILDQYIYKKKRVQGAKNKVTIASLKYNCFNPS